MSNKTCGECLYYDELMCDYKAMKVPNTRIACKLFDHTGRCCDCRNSIPHKSIANRYPLACTSLKKSGITIPHSPDEVVYCTGFKSK